MSKYKIWDFSSRLLLLHHLSLFLHILASSYLLLYYTCLLFNVLCWFFPSVSYTTRHCIKSLVNKICTSICLPRTDKNIYFFIMIEHKKTSINVCILSIHNTHFIILACWVFWSTFVDRKKNYIILVIE